MLKSEWKTKGFADEPVVCGVHFMDERWDSQDTVPRQDGADA